MILQNSYQKIWKIALLPIIDYISVFLGILVVFLVRYSWFEDNFRFERKISGQTYVFFDLSLSVLVVVIYALLGLYQINQKRSLFQTIVRLFFGISVVILSLITYFFFNEYNRDLLPEGVPISRFIMATGTFFAFSFVLLGRFLVWLIEQTFYALGIGKISVALVSKDLDKFYFGLKKEKHIRHVYTFSLLTKNTYKKLENLIIEGNISEIYLSNSQNSELLSLLANLAERYKINMLVSPDGLIDFYAVKLKPTSVKNKLFLEVQRSNLDGWNVVFKRIFDILFALTFILVFGWLYLLTAIAIKLDSKGKIFYASERIGPDGKVFTAYKFRRLRQEYCTTESNTASLEAEAKLIEQSNVRKDGILYKIANDPRSTRVGKFIEKYSIDELPQFFNVLLGNMSVVGPRPHQPREVAKYRSHHFRVLNIKPGITGYAQINGRSDLDFETEVKLDTFYLENWSFWLDLKIIILTPITMIFKRHQS